MNELLEELSMYNEFKVIAFADDILIILRAKASFHFKELPAGPLKLVSDWAGNHFLKFNLSKSNFTVLKRGKNTHIYQL